MSTTTVGVVIRTLNESELIGRCLETLHRQRGPFELDLVVVDSGSTDATLDIARSHGAKIIELPPGDFDYSKALNLGFGEAGGELVLSLSAHSVPVNDTLLSTMTAHFAEADVAGVSCRQVPWPDAPWQERHRLGHQFPARTETYSAGHDQPIVFSNAASLIRRAVWRECPFILPAAEDLDWAQRVVRAGWKVVYEAGTAVYHSHNEDARAQALRMIDINRVSDADASRRTRARTIREAAGIFVRDSRKIFGLDEPLRRKLVYCGSLAKMVGYYITDFSRAGTTAERRREDSRRSPHSA